MISRAALVFILIAGPAAAAETLRYNPVVVRLGGSVVFERRLGPPGYGETPDIDMKLEVPFLELKEPVDVVGDPADDLNSESESGLRRLQLVYDRNLKRFAGRKVVVTGTLVHSHLGYHFTPVIVWVNTIERAGR